MTASSSPSPSLLTIMLYTDRDMSYTDRDMSLSQLGQRIHAARMAKSLTQAALAKKARVSRIYVAMLETGARQTPSLPVAERIAKALGVKLVDLLK